MAVLTRNNIVTNGLVLNLDSLNPQSIPLDPTVNLLTNSQNFTGSGWSSANMTVTTSSMVAPYGNGTATLISTFNSYSAIAPSINVTGGGIYTTSYFVKYITQSVYTLVHEGSPYSPVTFDIQAGKLLSIGGTPGFIYTASIAPAPNDYYRISLTVNITQSLFTLSPRLWMGYYTGNSYSGSQLYVWGAQVERSPYPTPYVASITSSGQRTSWFDLSGNNNTSTLLTGSIPSSIPQYTYLNERVLNFDGTGSHAYLGNPSSLSPSNLTINAWFYIPTASLPGQMYILRNRGFGYGISVNNSKSINFFVYPNSTASVSYTIPGTKINFNTWYNVTATYGSSSLRMYLNGNLESGDITSPTNIIYYSGQALGIGRDADADNSYFLGKIPTVQIYNRALTQTEISQNYNATKTRFGLT
jgi:hypothetical protein